MPRQRVNTAEKERRINTVAQWILEGAAYQTIIYNIIEKKWCTSKRQAEYYIKWGYESFKENVIDKERTSYKMIAIERHLSDRRAALARVPPNLKEAREAQKEINKLFFCGKN